MKRILILDDEQAVRDSLIDYFEDRLWKTCPAESAEEALGLIASESFSAAVVDVRLPGMDGNDFIRQALKQTRRLSLFVQGLLNMLCHQIYWACQMFLHGFSKNQ